MSSHSAPSRMALSLRRLAGVAAALALAALSGEILVRATGALDHGPVPRRLVVRAPLPDLPFRLRPGERLELLGREVRVSSLGLRGAEVARRAPPGSRRVLVLGDSVAFGWGLAEGDSFPAQLGQALRARGVAAEVLNAGVPGYSTPSEAALFRELAPVLGPDAVVLAVSLNDWTPTPALSPLGMLVSFDATPTPAWLARSELVAFLRWRLGRLRDALRAEGAAERNDRIALFLRRVAIADRERFYAEAKDSRWEPIERGLRALRDATQRAGTTLLVVIFPDEDQLEQPAGERRPQARWAERCAALELRCLDLAGSFERAAGAGGLFADLQHPNERGSRVAAEAAADALAPSFAP